VQCQFRLFPDHLAESSDTPKRTTQPDACPAIIKLELESFEKRQPIATGELVDQVVSVFRTPILSNTTSDILRGLPSLKSADSILIGRPRFLIDPNQIEEYCVESEKIV
jgi:hypothetical protein